MSYYTVPQHYKRGESSLGGQFSTPRSLATPSPAYSSESMPGHELHPSSNSSMAYHSPSSAESGLSDCTPSPPPVPKIFLGPTFECEICGEENSVKNKARHMKKHGTAPKSDNCKCVCGVPDFSRQDACERHMRRCKIAKESGELERREAAKKEKRRRTRKRQQQRIPKSAAQAFQVLCVDRMEPVKEDVWERPRSKSSRTKLNSSSVSSGATVRQTEDHRHEAVYAGHYLEPTLSVPDSLAPSPEAYSDISGISTTSSPAPSQIPFYLPQQRVNQFTSLPGQPSYDQEARPAPYIEEQLYQDQLIPFGESSHAPSQCEAYSITPDWSPIQGSLGSLGSLDNFSGMLTSSYQSSDSMLFQQQAYPSAFGYGSEAC